MKKLAFIIAVSLVGGSCTSDFEKYNKDQYGVSAEELNRVPQGGNQLIDLQKMVLHEQENSYQLMYDLPGCTGGYTSQMDKFSLDYGTFSPRSGWTSYPYDDTYPKIYKAFSFLRSASKGDFNKQYFALGSILRVGITQPLADMYGTLAYTQIKEEQYRVPFDDQRTLYLAFCEDLLNSIEGLKKVDVNDREYAPFDLVYQGDMSKWIKYANSLLLRIAIRISKAEPQKAQEYAEKAIAGGVIESNEDNASLPTVDNPAYKTSTTWNNSCVNAEITEYMNAFSDPRRSKYFTEITSRTAGKRFFGRRSGSPVPANNSDYSYPNLQKNSPIVWISASEVAFLKAEAALKGWNVGGKSAEELYKEGVALSFAQWAVSGVDAYLENHNQRGAFIDEKKTEFNEPGFSSPITVNWDDAQGDTEKQLARIITQKWIAMFPYGSIEAWSEWRRTGYPNFMPVQENRSAGVVSQIIRQSNGRDIGGLRRIPFTNKEYDNNRKNVQKAVQDLGGPDNLATELWWAK